MGLSLKVQRVAKSYHLQGQDLQILNDVCLEVAAGERLAIVGPSGSGKSTLLHLLGTLDHADRGEILYDGQSLAQFSQAQLALFRNRNIGIVFQFHHLLPEFTALENVMMPALIAREAPQAARQRAMQWLEEVGLSERAHHKPSELSGGEQQRVALCRALIMKPGLLLADEVTGNLDHSTAQGIHELLVRINQTTSTTLIIVTHNQALATQMGRTERLEKGLLTTASTTEAQAAQ